MALVYEELRGLAACWMAGERPDHTLQPTALVHEAYLRLARDDCGRWGGREHFLAVAARCIRRILINHARDRRAAKRGGGAARITLQEAVVPDPSRGSIVEVLDLEDALGELRERDERQEQVVELRFFGGLTVEEAARVLGVSPRTVEGDWAFARAWLGTRLRSLADR